MDDTKVDKTDLMLFLLNFPWIKMIYKAKSKTSGTVLLVTSGTDLLVYKIKFIFCKHQLLFHFNLFLSDFETVTPEAYSEPSRTCTMELFCENNHLLKIKKSSMEDVQLGSKVLGSEFIRVSYKHPLPHLFCTASLLGAYYY